MDFMAGYDTNVSIEYVYNQLHWLPDLGIDGTRVSSEFISDILVSRIANSTEYIETIPYSLEVEDIYVNMKYIRAFSIDYIVWIANKLSDSKVPVSYDSVSNHINRTLSNIRYTLDHPECIKP